MSTKLEMVLEAIDRASGPINGVVDQVDRLEKAAGRSSGMMGRAMSAIGTAAKVAAVTGVVALTAAVATGVDKAIAFESAMADVAKVADFKSPEALSQFSDDILDMSRRIPVAADGLATITAEAIQSGVALKDALDFTEMTAKSSVAFDMTADRAGEAFAKIKNVFKLDLSGLTDAADAVNHLSNNMAAKAPQIIDFLQRAGGAAPLIGMTAEEMGGLGSTMIALGTAPETAARGVTKLFTSLKTGSSNIEELVNTVGLTTQSFEKLLETDPTGAMEKLFEAVQKSPDGLRDLVGLVGQDFADDFLKVANNTELLAQAFALVGEKANYTGSVLKEYEARAATTANNIQLFKNNIAALQVEFGSRFLPAINSGLGELVGIMQTLDQRATLFIRMSTGISGFAAGLGLTSDAASGLKPLIDDLWTSVSQFLFGVADEEASTNQVGRIFHDMQQAGEALRGVLDTLGNAFDGLDLAERFAPLKDLVSGNLSMVGDILTNLGEAASSAFGDGSGARAAFDWLANLSLDGVTAALSAYAGAQGKVLGALKDLSAWFAEGVASIDWSAIVPGGGIDTSAIDALGQSLKAFVDATGSLTVIGVKSLKAYFEGYFEGLLPYLEPMRDKLGGIWTSISNALGSMADVFTRVAAALGLMSGSDMSGISTFGEVMGNVAGIVGNIALGTLEALARWVETMAGVLASLASGDLSGAVDEFRDFFSWLADFVLPDVDIAGYFSDLFSFSWSDVLPDWNWRDIIPPMPDMSGYLPDWLTGRDTPAAIDAPEVKGTDALKNALAGATPDIGSPSVGLPDMAAVEASQATVDALAADANAAQAAVVALSTEAQGIADSVSAGLNAARSAATGFSLAPEGAAIMASLESGIATGGGQAAGYVRSVMASIEAAASLNLFGKGASMMDTLAAGMRSRAQAAVQEMQNLAQQLRDHLPSSPAKVGPLSDIHRLKFGETIARSIRPEPVVRAMRGLTAAARAEMALGPAGLDGGLRSIPRLPASVRDIRVPVDEDRENDMVRRMAGVSQDGGSAGPGPSSGPGQTSRAIDASMHIGTVNYRTEADRDDFMAKLSQHRQEIKDLIDEEDRRRDRLRF